MEFITQIDVKFVTLFGRRWHISFIQFLKLSGIFGSILWACDGAIDAMLRKDHTNCILSLFAASSPTYIFSLHLISTYKMDWRQWPIKVIHIHIYANAFLCSLTAFSFSCCLVIFFLLDVRHTAFRIAESAAWLLYALTWQVIVGFMLKALSNKRYMNMEMSRKRKWMAYTKYVEIKSREFEEVDRIKV